MKTDKKLSVAIATYNEESFIKRCLDSIVHIADEIIVVDGTSTDQTQSIVKNYPKTKLIVTTNKPNFHLNKQLALDSCTSEWILQLDADEVVTKDLADEISQIINSNTELNGYWLNRSNYFLGRFLKKGGQYPDPTLRLYKNGFAHLPAQSVHEQAVVKGKTGRLKNDLLHYADASFSRYILRNDRYTSLIAKELFEQKLKINLATFFDYFLLKPFLWFFSTYFRHRGYVDGFPGFVFSYMSSLRFPQSYIKYWELTHAQNSH